MSYPTYDKCPWCRNYSVYYSWNYDIYFCFRCYWDEDSELDSYYGLG